MQKDEPAEDKVKGYLKKEILQSNDMQQNGLPKSEVSTPNNSKAIIHYKAPFTTTCHKEDTSSAEGCLRITPIVNNTAKTNTTTDDTCKTDIKDEDPSKPTIVHSSTQTEFLYTTGSSQTPIIGVKKESLRNVSDSSSDSVASGMHYETLAQHSYANELGWWWLPDR